MRFFKSLLPFFAGAISIFVLNVDARSQEANAIRYVTPVDHPVINTPFHRVDHLSSFDLSFALHYGSQRIKLELEPNHDILATDAAVRYIDADGNVRHEEAIERHDHKVFKGKAFVEAPNGRWNQVGWARIYLKQDGPKPLFEGAFAFGGDHHHIELQSTYLETMRSEDADITPSHEDYMVVYRDSDMVRYVHSELKRSLVEGSSCEAHKLGFNADPQHVLFQSNITDTSQWGMASMNSLFGLSKRQSDIGGYSGNSGGINLQSTIGDSSGCPDTKKVALIGVATDCSFTGSFNSSESARSHVINVVNTASDLYERSFNISIGLRNLTVSDAHCPESAPSAAPWNMPCDKSNITSRLDLFSEWRGKQSDNNAYWTLMSRCPTESEVGLSWLGQLCNAEVTTEGSESVSGTNFVVRTKGNWQVFAHETGHTFGAVHDCESQTCAKGWDKTSQCCPYSQNTCSADGKYIMNPTTGEDLTSFSPCTIGNICSAIGRNGIKSGCLSDNKGVTTITGSQCGNGIVEAGEECDCGGEESCADNNCCNPKTCKFKDGAVCDDSNDACCSSCQFSKAGTVCRASKGECDIQETCSGNSSDCPADKYEKDGSKCGNGDNLVCASGHCTSRDYQCRSLMGNLLNTNNTWACDKSSCTLTCASADMGPNTCATMNQNFLDGTPCGSGGNCENGRCKGSSVNKAVKSWIDNHKDVVIGICCGVGGLIVLCILWCLINRCRRARAMKKMPPPTAQYGAPWPGAMPPYGPVPPFTGPPTEGYRGLGADSPPQPPPGYGPPPGYAPVYGRYA